MTAIFVVVAVLIGHPVGNLLHAKDSLVELRLSVPILGHHRDMSYGCEHGKHPPLIGFMSKLAMPVNCRRDGSDSRVSSLASGQRFRVSAFGLALEIRICGG